MNRGHAQPGIQVCMQQGNIAKANDPFRVAYKLLKIQPVNYPVHPITATATHNGLNGSVVQHTLKIGRPFFVGGRKSSAAGAHGGTGFDHKPPFFHFLNGRGQVVG